MILSYLEMSKTTVTKYCSIPVEVLPQTVTLWRLLMPSSDIYISIFTLMLSY